ncbi:MAG: FixH family protein [Nitrospirae bacterium]|nr:FixH family protein [Nitrospirota bacterium]
MKTTLIIVSIIGLAAVFGAVFIGSRSFDGTVTEKPYETGLDWDRAAREKKETGWDVTVNNRELKTGEVKLSLSVYDRRKAPLKDAAVTITLSRPGTAAYDRLYKADRDPHGSYCASVNFPLHGLWDINTSVTQDKKRVSFNERTYVEQGGVK